MEACINLNLSIRFAELTAPLAVGEDDEAQLLTLANSRSLPHRQRTVKLSNDPFFIEKVRDIVGLYLNPPDHAVVLCVDEKSPIQALERTQPMLQMELGYVKGATHDYVRHGTTTLFGALHVATGEVLSQCKPRHWHQEFLAACRT